MTPPQRTTIGEGLALILDHIREIQKRQFTLSAIALLIKDNIQREQKLMSQLTDWAASEQADLAAISTALDTVVTGVSALDNLITNFQNSPGTLSATDQSALDAIQSASHTLVTKAQAISTVPPVQPAV